MKQWKDSDDVDLFADIAFLSHCDGKYLLERHITVSVSGDEGRDFNLHLLSQNLGSDEVTI